MCMKKNSVAGMIGIFLLCLNAIGTFAQRTIAKTETALIEPFRLGITFNKTTNLVFPYAIKSIDRGSQEVLVQKAIGVENILQVKAGKANFKETNLTVVTSDGSLYSYLLTYTERPAELNIRVSNTNKAPEPLAVFSKDATTGEIEQNAEQVSVKKPPIKNRHSKKNDISIALNGLYVQENTLYFQIRLENSSALNYDINMLRFFIRDKKRSKRTASQEPELHPDYTHGNAAMIRNNSEQTVVVAVPKFTIPDKKQLVIQLMEKDGGRHLVLTLSNRDIVKAATIR